uniref:Uncharacterized protein n=1 Tax=Avena sativa TaxID=4498 RepID=A0ACD5U458_AVESA
MAGEGDVKLLGAAVSPFAVLARMALEMKGVRYEYVDEDMGNKSELLLRSNPVHKKVPVLIHHGRPVCESLAIVEFVDEVWDAAGPSILPTVPYQRATARFWAAYTDGKLFPAYFGIQRAATETERAEKVREMVEVISQLEAALANGKKPFFAGDRVGYLDIVVGCHLFWLEAFSGMFGVALVDASKTPLFAAWAERFGEDEVASKGVVPGADKVVEYFKKKRQDNPAAGTAAK